MTNRKVIEVLEKLNETTDEQEAIEKAIDAVELQIPERPKRFEDDEQAKCPECYEGVEWRIDGVLRRLEYCPRCGKKLNWHSELTDELINACEELKRSLEPTVQTLQKIIFVMLKYRTIKSDPDKSLSEIDDILKDGEYMMSTEGIKWQIREMVNIIKKYDKQ